MKLSKYLSDNSIEQQDFAKLIRVTGATVSRYVTGQRRPRRAVAKRIERVTDGEVTLQDIYA